MAPSRPRSEFLNPAEAARRLGVSPKALRLYEQRGLLTPVRTGAGWRAYGPAQMARGGEIAALRALGLSLAQTAAVLAGDAAALQPALAAHEAVLAARAGTLAETLARVRRLRADLAAGRAPEAGAVAGAVAGLLAPGDAPTPVVAVALDLPWPWNGERFALPALTAITYIVGPLGSGKTRLAMALAETIPGAVFVGLERAAAEGPLDARAEAALDWLTGEGAARSAALEALAAALTDPMPGDGAPSAVVVDMLEEGLDAPAQAAVVSWLKARPPGARPVLALTRSNLILDLETVGPDETVILCPANHSPPMLVTARPGAAGYEAVALCLGSPEARARTAGIVAIRNPSLPFMGRDSRPQGGRVGQGLSGTGTAVGSGATPEGRTPP